MFCPHVPSKPHDCNSCCRFGAARVTSQTEKSWLALPREQYALLWAFPPSLRGTSTNQSLLWAMNIFLQPSGAVQKRGFFLGAMKAYLEKPEPHEKERERERKREGAALGCYENLPRYTSHTKRERERAPSWLQFFLSGTQPRTGSTSPFLEAGLQALDDVPATSGGVEVAQKAGIPCQRQDAVGFWLAPAIPSNKNIASRRNVASIEQVPLI